MRPFKRCKHEHIRGVYGDEIIFCASWRRLQCIDCGRYLKGSLSRANVDPFTGRIIKPQKPDQPR